MVLRIAACALALVALSACYGSGSSDLSREGHGRPRLSIEFPSSTTAGATEELVVHVSNPGPGAMDSIFLAFTNVGVPGSGIGTALVPFGRRGENPAIASVSPEPDAVSDDGVVYRFPGLEVGASATITFSVVVPSTPGPAANSLQVYDGSEPDRAAGIRVGTTVRG